MTEREVRQLPGQVVPCGRCGARIVWAATAARDTGPGGKAMPLDAVEDRKGNVAVQPGHGGVMGFTTSFRMGQLLRYALEVPAPTEQLERFMVTTFVDAVRSCLSDGGWLKKSSEQEEGGTFLVGVAGELFSVWGDFQVARSVDEYDAVGCGHDLAKGAMYGSRGRAARYRLQGALSAAAYHSGGVVDPFTIVRTRRPA